MSQTYKAYNTKRGKMEKIKKKLLNKYIHL